MFLRFILLNLIGQEQQMFFRHTEYTFDFFPEESKVSFTDLVFAVSITQYSISHDAICKQDNFSVLIRNCILVAKLKSVLTGVWIR